MKKLLLKVFVAASIVFYGLPSIAGIEARWKVAGIGKFGSEQSPDIVLFRAETGQVAIWDMTQPVSQYVTTSAGDASYSLVNNWSVKNQKVYTLPGLSSWKIGVVVDVNGDSVSDLVWYEPSTGNTALWIMNSSLGYQGVSSMNVGANSGWEIIGAGNFDGDGKRDDILWFNTSSGAVAVWLMEGGAIQQTKFVGTAAPGWKPSAIFDKNNDGISDIHFEKGGNQAVYWQINSNSTYSFSSPATQYASTAPGIPYAPCSPCVARGSGDYVGSRSGVSTQYQVKGDGKEDIVLQNLANGGVYVFSYDGTGDTLGSPITQPNLPSTYFNSSNIPTNPPQDLLKEVGTQNWKVVATADFDQYTAYRSGAGFSFIPVKTSDILFQDAVTGRLYLQPLETGSASQKSGSYRIGRGTPLPEANYQALP
jgi:hypothetical protein